MELRSEDLPNGIKLIVLSGRMDIAGTQQIDTQFGGLTAGAKALIAVDVSDVSFLASIGMRTLVSSARELMHRGGAMVLVNPKPIVNQALVAAGIDSLIPVCSNVDAAERELKAAAER